MLLQQIPCTVDLLTTSGMQLALLVQPLALPHPSEEPIQVMIDRFIFVSFFNFLVNGFVFTFMFAYLSFIYTYIYKKILALFNLMPFSKKGFACSLVYEA